MFPCALSRGRCDCNAEWIEGRTRETQPKWMTGEMHEEKWELGCVLESENELGKRMNLNFLVYALVSNYH